MFGFNYLLPFLGLFIGFTAMTSMFHLIIKSCIKGDDLTIKFPIRFAGLLLMSSIYLSFASVQLLLVFGGVVSVVGMLLGMLTYAHKTKRPSQPFVILSFSTILAGTFVAVISSAMFFINVT